MTERESETVRDIKREISDDISESYAAGRLNDHEQRAARNIVGAFDLSSALHKSLFEKYYDTFETYTFIQLLAALKATTWTEIGEEPIDKLLELEARAQNDSLFRDLPPEILAVMMVDGNSVDEDEIDDEEEEEDEDDEEEIDYYEISRSSPESLFL